MKENNKMLGNKGEALAIKYLQDKGYKIVETNYRNKVGEIDIIAKEKEYIVFIEVKYRSHLKTGRPAEAINYYKQRKICAVAKYYAMKHKLYDFPIRFDVVEVVGNQVTVIPFAFQTV